MDARRALRVPEVASILDQFQGRPPTNSQHTPYDLARSLLVLRFERGQITDRIFQEMTVISSAYNYIYPPVAFIPPEVLAEIFSYLFDPVPRKKNDFLNAMATCKRWRTVACHTPRFWCHIRINNYALTKASLERSQNFPLLLVLEDAPCDRIGAVVDLLKPHSSRVKTVQARHSDLLVLRVLFEKLVVSAPKLESLHMHYINKTDELTITSVFEGGMPSLRLLDLDSVSVPLRSISSRGLVELQLRQTLPPLPDLLNLLELCPSLQRLVVDGYEPWDGSSQMPDDRMVSLPSLQQLTVRIHPMSEIDQLLSCLVLPETAALRIDVNLMTDDSLDFPNLVDCPNLPCLTALRRLEVLWDNGGCILARAYRKLQQDVAPDVEMEFCGAESSADIPCQWPFDTSQVEVFVFRMEGIETHVNTWDILTELPSITTLRLMEPDTWSLGLLLTRLWERHSTDPSRFQYCEGLETLELFDFEWSNDLVGMMELMIRMRQENSSTLKNVHIFNSTDAPDTLKVPEDGQPVRVVFG